jgi:Baseplate J-like protein
MAEFISAESIGLFVPDLDPRDEEDLYQQSRLSVLNNSQGLLNNFNEGSAISALLRGFAFCGSEIQYRNKQILLALVVKYLEVTGNTRNLGAKAKVDVKFTLTTTLATTFRVPANFEVTDFSGEIRFYTDSVLEIPPNTLSGTVQATAENIGTQYNIDPFSIIYATTPLAFLASVTNPESATPGIDQETLQYAIDKSITLIRTQTLSSVPSYEDAAKLIMGEGSKAVCIPKLNAQKTGFNNGVMHLFLLDNLGDPASTGLINDVFRDFNDRIQGGTTLLVSPMEVLYVETVLNCKLNGVKDSDESAELLWLATKQYFASLEPHDSVITRSLEYQLMLTGVIDYIEETRINGNLNKIPMPNAYTIGREYNLRCEMITPTNQPVVVVKGELEPLDYNPE